MVAARKLCRQRWEQAYTTQEKTTILHNNTLNDNLTLLQGQRVMYCTHSHQDHGYQQYSNHQQQQCWESGRIVKCWVEVEPTATAASRPRVRSTYRSASSGAPPGARPQAGESGGGETRWVPYEIMLDSGCLAFALRDEASEVRPMREGERATVSVARKRHLLNTWKAAPTVLKLAAMNGPKVGPMARTASTVACDRVRRGLDDDRIEVRPEEWYASVLRSEIQGDLWKMFKLASMSSGGSSLDLDTTMPIFQAIQPGITRAEIEQRFAEMDADDSGDISFEELQNLWWSCILQGSEVSGTGDVAAGDTDVLREASAKLAETVEGIKTWRAARAKLNFAAPLLARAFTGRTLQSLRKHFAAAVFIQACWRMVVSARNFGKLRRCIRLVQRRYRQKTFWRLFRKRDAQQLELVKQWSRRSVDVSSLLPRLVSVPDFDEQGDSADGLLFLKRCSSDTMTVDKYESCQAMLRSEKSLRAFMERFGETSMVRRYFTTERWHEATASGRYKDLWPPAASTAAEKLERADSTADGRGGPVWEARALVCFHDPSAAQMALSSTGSQFAADSGLRFAPAVAEWTAPREASYTLAARATRSHVKRALDSDQKAKQRKHAAKVKSRMAASDSRSHLTRDAVRSPSETGGLSSPTPTVVSQVRMSTLIPAWQPQQRHRDSGDDAADANAMGVDHRAAMAAWWTSVVAVHTGVLASSPSGRCHSEIRATDKGTCVGNLVEHLDESSPYAAMQREMAAATNRLRQQRMGRARQPVAALGLHGNTTSNRTQAADAALMLAAAVAVGGAEQISRKCRESHSHRQRFTAMEAQPAGQLLPQCADPTKVEAARIKQARRQAALAALAAAGRASPPPPPPASAADSSATLTDINACLCGGTRLEVHMKADALAAELLRTEGPTFPGTTAQRRRRQQQLEQDLASSLTLALWLRGIDAPGECFSLLNSAGLRSLDDLLDADLTEPQLMHMGFTQMKKRKDALKSIATMVQQQVSQPQAQPAVPQAKRRHPSRVSTQSPRGSNKSSSSSKSERRSRVLVGSGWTSRCSGSRRPMPPKDQSRRRKHTPRITCAGSSRTKVQPRTGVEFETPTAVSEPGVTDYHVKRPGTHSSCTPDHEITDVHQKQEVDLADLYTRVDDVSWVTPLSAPR